MDIRDNKDRFELNIFTPVVSVVVSILFCLSLLTGYYVSIQYAILIFSLILCVVGISTTDSWSKELEHDGYAAISHLYGGYFAALFLFLSITPIMYLIIHSFVAIILGIFISLFYASIISAVAFRRIDEEDRKQSVVTYTGPAVVYDVNGPYVKHTENVAFNDRD